MVRNNLVSVLTTTTDCSQSIACKSGTSGLTSQQLLISSTPSGTATMNPIAAFTKSKDEQPESELTKSALLKASTPPSDALFSTLITANHILHYHSVCDAYGHISVRNPQDPSTFFISKSLAPALVSSKEDIELYRVSDASPVNEGAPKGYVERFVHSEVYKKYKDVNAVIHSHSEAVLPFSISSIPVGT